MKYSDILKYYGSEASAARAIGESRQRVHRWKETGNVPMIMQIRFEEVSHRKLRADISEKTRKMLGK